MNLTNASHVNLTNASHVKRPEDIEIDTLLARAKQLSAELTETIPPSQRRNRTWRNWTAARSQGHSSNATRNNASKTNATRADKMADFRVARPEEWETRSLLAKAEELAAELARSDDPSGNFSDNLTGIFTQPSRFNHTHRRIMPLPTRGNRSVPDIRGNDTTGNETQLQNETEVLVARAQELTAVLAKDLPPSLRPHARPETAGLEDLIARARELSEELIPRNLSNQSFLAPIAGMHSTDAPWTFRQPWTMHRAAYPHENGTVAASQTNGTVRRSGFPEPMAGMHSMDAPWTLRRPWTIHGVADDNQISNGPATSFPEPMAGMHSMDSPWTLRRPWTIHGLADDNRTIHSVVETNQSSNESLSGNESLSDELVHQQKMEELLARAKSLRALIKNETRRAQEEEDLGMRDLLSRAKALSSVLAKADTSELRPRLNTSTKSKRLREAMLRHLGAVANRTANRTEQSVVVEPMRYEEMDSLLAKAKQLAAELAKSDKLTGNFTQPFRNHTHRRLIPLPTRIIPLPGTWANGTVENLTHVGADALLARAKELLRANGVANKSANASRSTEWNQSSPFSNLSAAGTDALLARAKQLHEATIPEPLKHEETDSLMARVRELSAVLSKNNNLTVEKYKRHQRNLTRHLKHLTKRDQLPPLSSVSRTGSNVTSPLKSLKQAEEDTLLARARELTAVLSKATPANWTKSRRNHTEPKPLAHSPTDHLVKRAKELTSVVKSSNEEQATAMRMGSPHRPLKNYTGAETDALLARAKELSGIIEADEPHSPELVHSDVNELVARGSELKDYLKWKKDRPCKEVCSRTGSCGGCQRCRHDHHLNISLAMEMPACQMPGWGGWAPWGGGGWWGGWAPPPGSNGTQSPWGPGAQPPWAQWAQTPWAGWWGGWGQQPTATPAPGSQASPWSWWGPWAGGMHSLDSNGFGSQHSGMPYPTGGPRPRPTGGPMPNALYPMPFPAEVSFPAAMAGMHSMDTADSHQSMARGPYPTPHPRPYPTPSATPGGHAGRGHGRYEYYAVDHLWTPDPYQTCSAKTEKYNVEANHWCETHCLGCGNSCDCPPSLCECHNRTEAEMGAQTQMGLCSSVDYPTGRPYECFTGFAAETDDPFSSSPWYDERHCESACVHPFLDLTSGVAEWRGFMRDTAGWTSETHALPAMRKSLKYFQPAQGNWIDNTRTGKIVRVSFLLTASEATSAMLKLKFSVDNLGSNHSFTATLNDEACTRHWGYTSTCAGNLAAWYSLKGLDSRNQGALMIQTNSSTPLKAGVNVLTIQFHDDLTRKSGIYLAGGVYPVVPGPPNASLATRRELDFLDAELTTTVQEDEPLDGTVETTLGT